jgi:hypothetical protein
MQQALLQWQQHKSAGQEVRELVALGAKLLCGQKLNKPVQTGQQKTCLLRINCLAGTEPAAIVQSVPASQQAKRGMTHCMLWCKCTL